MNVRLVDGPGVEYSHINVQVLRVEIAREDGGFLVLGRPNRVIDLLALRGGVSAELAKGATIPAGGYSQMRLVLGANNTVTLADGTVEPLKVPSGMQSGIKMPVSFDVAAGTTRDVVIDFDAHKSIFLHVTGNSKYILRPVVRAFDVLATGSVHGRVTDVATGVGLPGAVVTAQQFDVSGRAEIVRSAMTGLDGSYTLDLLLAGGTYYVVTQPVVGTAAYDARASAGFTIAEATPIASIDLAVPVAAATGGLEGAITPVAAVGEADYVEVRQALLDAGGTLRTFIVRGVNADIAATGESYGFALVPVGTYDVSAVRSTDDAEGNALFVARSISLPALVVASLVARVDLMFAL
jgi:hypothetical protein